MELRGLNGLSLPLTIETTLSTLPSISDARWVSLPLTLVHVSDGSEDGTKGLTENGIEELQSLLADIRTWDGGIREFLIESRCDPEIIDRIMVDEMKRGL